MIDFVGSDGVKINIFFLEMKDNSPMVINGKRIKTLKYPL